MAVTNEQQIARTIVHARQLQRLMPVVERMEDAALFDLQRLVGACADSVAQEVRRRQAKPVRLATKRVGRRQSEITDDHVRAMRHAYDAAANMRGLIPRWAKEHGVRPSTIRAIVLRKIRTDVA